MLDGAARLDDLFERTAELGMPAIAMTDHGNVFGAYEFYTKATAPASSRSSAWRPTSRPTPRFERKRVSWYDGGDDDVSAVAPTPT